MNVYKKGTENSRAVPFSPFEYSLSLEVGRVLEVTIVKISAETVLVDVGYSLKGRIPLREFLGNEGGGILFQPGDKINARIVRKNEIEGIILSYERNERLELFKLLSKLQECKAHVKGTILRWSKGGYIVDIEGIEAFLPSNLFDIRLVVDPESIIGKEFDFRILKVEYDTESVLVSRRAILEEERQERLDKLSEGQIVQGTVTNVTDYGAFIDVDGVSGLLHISDMSWEHVRHPEGIAPVGTRLSLLVLSFDKTNGKLSLGLKQLTRNPWEEIEQYFALGMRVKGKVSHVAEYGIFVEIGHGFEGFVHSSEMSWNRYKSRRPANLVRLGDEVEAIILDINPEKRRINLGMKQLTPNPWDQIAEKYPQGTILEGIVNGVTEFGVFVGIEEGVDGLIHVSDLALPQGVMQPSMMYSIGDRIQAKVLVVSQEREKLILGVKQIISDPWDHVATTYTIGQVVKGTVSNVMDFGLFVCLEEGLEGLIHSTEIAPLGEEAVNPEDLFSVGDEVVAQITSISHEERRIALSISQMYPQEDLWDEGYQTL